MGASHLAGKDGAAASHRKSGRAGAKEGAGMSPRKGMAAGARSAGVEHKTPLEKEVRERERECVCV